MSTCKFQDKKMHASWKKLNCMSWCSGSWEVFLDYLWKKQANALRMIEGGLQRGEKIIKKIF